MNWHCIPFLQLTLTQLYNIMALRQSVFIVEQNCPYLDADGKDIHALHILAYDNQNKLSAYARLLPPNISYPEASIGRVITAATHRNSGLGITLMQYSIQQLFINFEKQPIRIGAQLYLQKFYEKFGFYKQSEPYLEDNILHIIMLKQ